MAKKEYEKLMIDTVFLDTSDIVTVSVEDGDGENYGTANKDWYTGGKF